MLARTLHSQLASRPPCSALFIPLLTVSSHPAIRSHRRYATQSQQEAQPPEAAPLPPPRRKSKATDTAITHSFASKLSSNPAHDIDPPDSTRPAPIDLTPRDPNDSTFSHLLKLGKAYLGFYKAGMKNTWTNWRAVDQVRQRHRIPNTHNMSLYEAVIKPDSTMTRRDYQLLCRGSKDVKKLLPFGLVLLVCGEFTVLLVPWLGAVIPKTCWVPAQILGARRKWEDRRRLSFQRMEMERQKVEAEINRQAEKVAQINGQEPKVKEEQKKVAAAEAQKESKAHTDSQVATSTSPTPPRNEPGEQEKQPITLGELRHMLITLRLAPPFLINTLTAQPLLLAMRSKLQYLILDDILIERARGVRHLSDFELQVAAEERGLDVLGVQTDVLRRRLEEWLRIARQAVETSYYEGYTTIGELLVTRPDDWATIGGGKYAKEGGAEERRKGRDAWKVGTDPAVVNKKAGAEGVGFEKYL